jgi:predicted Zn-dependent peptidase
MFALLATLVIAPAARAEAPTIPFTRYELPNGLQVLLLEDHRLPQVCVDIWYKVGSKDEVERRSGFAHLFEHLMFMGTFRLPGSGFDQLMEAHGGWNNAWTMEDATNYYDVGPPNLLQSFLWMEADRMQQLGQAMTQEKLDLQRDVVRNERRQSNEDRPYGMVEIELTTAMFPVGHPYAHSVIGSHEDLQAAAVSDVQDFFATWYVPNNASLVVSGDFDPTAARGWIDQYFGVLTRRELPARPAPVAVAAPQKATVTITDQVDYPQLNLFWHSPGAFQAGDAEMSLLADLLGDGESSRLYRKLVDAGLAQSADVFQYGLAYGGIFGVSVIPMTGVTLEQVEAVINAELAAVANVPPSGEEMERLRNQRMVARYQELEPLQNRAESLNRYWAYTGSPDWLSRDIARFAEARPEALSAAAAQYLKPGLASKIVVLPEPPAAAASPAETR